MLTLPCSSMGAFQPQSSSGAGSIAVVSGLLLVVLLGAFLVTRRLSARMADASPNRKKAVYIGAAALLLFAVWFATR